MTRDQYRALRRIERDSYAAYRRHLRNELRAGKSIDAAQRTAPRLLMVCPRPHVMGAVGLLIHDQAQRRAQVLREISARKAWDFQREQIQSAPIHELFKRVSLDFIGPRPTPHLWRIAA